MLSHHEAKKKNKKGLLTAKLDISKAYNRIEWCLMEKMMRKLDFEERWIKMIMNCVTTVSYSLLVNGHQSEVFKPERGLRQGDKLSPYLFLLCVEGLSSLAQKAVREGKIHGIKVSHRAPEISHLLFADDNIFFTRATAQECQQLRDILRIYEEESGQKVNLQKSELSFSPNMKREQREALAAIMGMKQVEYHGKYLGLPTIIGREKKSVFTALVDRVRRKIKNGKNKTLSIAAKEVLLKVVAQSQVTYTMSVFMVPDGSLDEIRRAISSFWWGQQKEEKRIPWKAWKNMCKPKEEGGMGFKDIKLFNQAMVGKHLWNLMTKPDSLAARVLKAKYYPNGDVMNARLGHNPSYTWRSLLAIQDLVKSGRRWRIGNGADVNI
ncbi:unnamed protein product [Linum trigynum]|uniref:Reverse transcriptase domain-containing protein n=1 Tax=Linum trigynum TaxID=586398 RepID=A0AAV2FPI3_9ROSI